MLLYLSINSLFFSLLHWRSWGLRLLYVHLIIVNLDVSLLHCRDRDCLCPLIGILLLYLVCFLVLGNFCSSISIYFFLFISLFKLNFSPFLSAKDMFSNIVREGDTPMDGSWFTLSAPLIAFLLLLMGYVLPFKCISPASDITPFLMLRRVLFPQPLGPMMAVHLFASILGRICQILVFRFLFLY